MDIILFLALGFLDGIAIVALGFKVFRFPISWYKREIGLIALILTCCSYIIRILVGFPELDMIIQYGLIVLFFRYLLKLKLFDSLMIPAVGYLIFDLVQLIIYPQMISLGMISLEDIQQNIGYGTYLVQVTGQVVCLITCWLLYRLNLGFSFVTCPPHDVDVRFSLRGHDLLMFLGVLCSSLVFSGILYWLFHYHNQWKIVTAAIVMILVLMLVIAYKKEADDI